MKYIDSSGIASLLEVLKEARNKGKKFVLFGLTAGVREVLQLTRLTGVFEIYETEEEVLQCRDTRLRVWRPVFALGGARIESRATHRTGSRDDRAEDPGGRWLTWEAWRSWPAGRPTSRLSVLSRASRCGRSERFTRPWRWAWKRFPSSR